MKFVIGQSMSHDVLALQSVYQVTLISDKGLVFMHRSDWERICRIIDEHSAVLASQSQSDILSDKFCPWIECFIVAYDESEDYSCHAISNFELFSLYCRHCDIWPVLLPMWNLVDYVREFNAHRNKDALGGYIESRGDVLIDVEDN